MLADWKAGVFCRAAGVAECRPLELHSRWKHRGRGKLVGLRVPWHTAPGIVFRPGSRSALLSEDRGATASGSGRRVGCGRELVRCPVDAAEWAWLPVSHVILKDRMSPPAAPPPYPGDRLRWAGKGDLSSGPLCLSMKKMLIPEG